MEICIVQGPCRLKGQVEISGSKNASLPILASTLLFDKTVELKNLPKVKDVETMLSLLKSLGSKITINNVSKNENVTMMSLSGVKQFPMRVKCATLAWHTLISAAEGKKETVNTEEID